MMALMFFALWMLASLALVAVWLFRSSPPVADDAPRPNASTVKG